MGMDVQGPRRPAQARGRLVVVRLERGRHQPHDVLRRAGQDLIHGPRRIRDQPPRLDSQQKGAPRTTQAAPTPRRGSASRRLGQRPLQQAARKTAGREAGARATRPEREAVGRHEAHPAGPVSARHRGQQGHSTETQAQPAHAPDDRTQPVEDRHRCLVEGARRMRPLPQAGEQGGRPEPTGPHQPERIPSWQGGQAVDHDCCCDHPRQQVGPAGEHGSQRQPDPPGLRQRQHQGHRKNCQGIVVHLGGVAHLKGCSRQDQPSPRTAQRPDPQQLQKRRRLPAARVRPREPRARCRMEQRQPRMRPIQVVAATASSPRALRRSALGKPHRPARPRPSGAPPLAHEGRGPAHPRLRRSGRSRRGVLSHRQRHPHPSASARLVAERDVAPRRLDDLAAGAQPESGPLAHVSCREEGLEGTVQCSGSEAMSVVAHLHRHETLVFVEEDHLDAPSGLLPKCLRCVEQRFTNTRWSLSFSTKAGGRPAASPTVTSTDRNSRWWRTVSTASFTAPAGRLQTGAPTRSAAEKLEIPDPRSPLRAGQQVRFQRRIVQPRPQQLDVAENGERVPDLVGEPLRTTYTRQLLGTHQYCASRISWFAARGRPPVPPFADGRGQRRTMVLSAADSSAVPARRPRRPGSQTRPLRSLRFPSSTSEWAG